MQKYEIYATEAYEDQTYLWERGGEIWEKWQYAAIEDASIS